MHVFETGAVRNTDPNKENYVDSVSWTAIQRFAKYMKGHEAAHGKGNWKKGIPIDNYEESLMRHLQKYFANKYDGANLEPEVDHLAAAWFNLQGIIHEESKIKNA